jgi:hypothetical protein
MQMEKAKRLREQWGDKPCDNPRFDKEYYLGADTGDKVCTICGHYDWEHTTKGHSQKRKEQGGER